MSPTVGDRTKEVRTLIQTYSSSDPRLYAAVNALADEITQLKMIIDPIVRALNPSTGKLGAPPPPDNIQYQILENGSIRLSWDRPPKGASYTFEIRAGFSWNDAQFITRTTNTVVDLLPIPGQSSTYLIKSIDVLGTYSNEPSSVTLIIEPPAAVSLTGEVIDNNVLLRWNTPVSQFLIDYYEVSKAGLPIGRVRGTFTSFFEIIAGNYVYTVTPVDIVGNRGTSSMVTLQVNQPPDYVLTSSITSTFQGARNRVLLQNDPLLGA